MNDNINPELLDYHLAAGQVMFVDQETSQLVGIVMNTLITTEVGAGINARAIGRIQQAFQANLAQRIGAPQQVKDVVILNITKLGTFTPESFQKGSPLDQAMAQEAGHA